MPIIKILVKSKQFAQKTNQKVGKILMYLLLIIKQKVIIRVFPVCTGINRRALILHSIFCYSKIAILYFIVNQFLTA